MIFVIKTEIRDPSAATFKFAAQKTMYEGKNIAQDDILYIFASENQGGCGLIARGRVISAGAVPKLSGVERQTPRVSITVKVTAFSEQPLGRTELKPYTDWNDPRPEVELNFKLYRQATNKIVGVTPQTAAFLETFFRRA